MKLLLLILATTVQAAPFADPFRPPRQAEQAASGERAAPIAATRLESVLIAPDRRIAVINGQQYTEGARFGSGRVLRISEAEVVIRHADRDEAIKLFPQGIKK
jgi:MSHA biogenesis protein MshK